jgi:pimeloyl-ACP methyl ester carboxylesterase
MPPQPGPVLARSIDPSTAPEPDREATPAGYVVLMEPADRVHFLDWGGPADATAPGALLVHGLATSADLWAPVARRLRRRVRTVAMDLRGHGLSDSPTDGYEPVALAEDAFAVADASGFVREGAGVVIAGHGFGACVAAWTAGRIGPACRGLVLVDGGWEDVGASTGLETEEFLRNLDEPPEVMRSLDAYLADRAAFDPGTWDADQEAAARALVVETAAGRLVPVTRPHVVHAIVAAMFAYRPLEALGAVDAPIVILAAAEDEAGHRREALDDLVDGLRRAGRAAPTVVSFPTAGHNLMRYRPAHVTAAILALAETAPQAGNRPP